MFETCGNNRSDPSRMDRRGFVRSGLAAAGTLLGATVALAGPFRRNTYLPSSELLPPIAPAAPATPAARPTTMVFEVGSGVSPQLMARCVQDFLTATMSQEYAAGIGQLAKNAQRACAERLARQGPLGNLANLVASLCAGRSARLR